MLADISTQSNYNAIVYSTFYVEKLEQKEYSHTAQWSGLSQIQINLTLHSTRFSKGKLNSLFNVFAYWTAQPDLDRKMSVVICRLSVSSS